MRSHPIPSDLEEVLVSMDSMQIQMARDLLEAGGIESFVFDGASSRMLGSTAAVPARLMVYAADGAEARARLRDLGFTE